MDNKEIKQVFDILNQPFDPKDIEWRPQRFVKNGNTKALAYVTARAVMERLDEAVGPANWEMEFTPIDMGVSSKFDKQGNQTDYKGFICSLTLHLTLDDGSQKSVTRQDVANLTEFEAIKGGASGAIKRAAVQFGVGRYLYGIGDTWAKTGEHGEIIEIPHLPDWALPEGYVYPDKLSVETTLQGQPSAEDFYDATAYADTVTNGDLGDDPVITFGKHKGKHFSEIPLDYIDWLSKNANKPDIKQAASAWVANHKNGGSGSEDAPW